MATEYEMRRLGEIRASLEGLPGFPSSLCQTAKDRVCDELRLRPQSGYFVTDKGPLTHHWNVHPVTGEIIDLTADQFDASLPPVYVTKSDHRYIPNGEFV